MYTSLHVLPSNEEFWAPTFCIKHAKNIFSMLVLNFNVRYLGCL